MNTLIQNEHYLKAEYKRWELLLCELKNENAFMMLQLSDFLEGNVGNDFILKAEYFQNECIIKDEYIKDMENDIKAELQLMDKINDDKIVTGILLRYEKFKNEIKYLEKNCLKLKTDFEKIVVKN